MTFIFFELLFAAILGACLGSFANMLAVRLHEASSVLGRSRCPECRHPIRAHHLVPVVSWLMLGGRCADCGARIHIQYPLVELAAIFFTLVAAYRYSPFGPEAGRFYLEMVLWVALLVMVVMDARWKELPVEMMIGVAAVALAGRAAFLTNGETGALLSFVSATMLAIVVPVVFFGTQWLMSHGTWVGTGDIWFGAMMGVILGSWQQTAIAIYFAYLIGGLGVLILFATGQAKRGMRVPFAPALALGLMLTLWFGENIQQYITNVF